LNPRTRNDVAALLVVAVVVEVRYRGDTGVRPRGVLANPPLLAANRVIVSPVVVFPPPAK